MAYPTLEPSRPVDELRSVLASLGPDDVGAVERVDDLVDHEDAGVRAAAARSLGAIGGEEASVRLVERLETAGDAVEERRFLEALGRCFRAEVALEPLLAAASGPDPRLARTALRALGRAALPGAVPRLLERLRDPAEPHLDEVARALGEIGAAEAVPDLIELVETTSDAGLRRAALQALAEIRAPAALPAIADHLDDDDRRTRRAALEAYGRISYGDVAEELFRLEEGADPELRGLARFALAAVLGRRGQRGEGRAARSGIEHLVLHLASVTDPWNGRGIRVVRELQRFPTDLVREAVHGLFGADLGRKAPDDAARVAGLLREIASPALVPDLLRIARDSRSPEAREIAVMAVGEAGSAPEAKALLDLLEEEPTGTVRNRIFRAVGLIGDPSGLDGCLAVATNMDERRSVRRSAVRAAARILAGGEAVAAEEVLGDLLDEVTEPVRPAVVEAVGRLRADGLLPRVAELVEGQPPEERVAAIRAAGRIGDGEARDLLLGALGRPGAPAEEREAALLAIAGWARRAKPGVAGRHVLDAVEDADDPDVLRAGVIALGWLEAPEGIAWMDGLLPGAGPRLRVAILEACRRIAHPDGAVLVGSALGDADPEVRRIAVEAALDVGDGSLLAETLRRLGHANEPDLLRRALRGIDPAAIDASPDASWTEVLGGLEEEARTADAAGRHGRLLAEARLGEALEGMAEAAGEPGELDLGPREIEALSGPVRDALGAASALAETGDASRAVLARARAVERALLDHVLPRVQELLPTGELTGLARRLGFAPGEEAPDLLEAARTEARRSGTSPALAAELGPVLAGLGRASRPVDVRRALGGLDGHGAILLAHRLTDALPEATGLGAPSRDLLAALGRLHDLRMAHAPAPAPGAEAHLEETGELTADLLSRIPSL